MVGDFAWECTLNEEGIPAGESRVFTAEGIATEAGEICNNVWVDPDDELAESNEEDNFAQSCVTVEGALPDLRTRIRDVEDPVGAGGTIDWRIRIRNIGTGDAVIPTTAPILRVRFSEELADVTFTPRKGSSARRSPRPGGGAGQTPDRSSPGRLAGVPGDRDRAD